MKRIVPVLCLILAALSRFSPLALAQGGPPFRSDDPDTPENKNWEINTVLLGDRNPSAGFYETPNLDINYGLGNRIQLKYEVPLSIHETRDPSDHFAAGLGDSLLGVKLRFFSHHPESAKPDSNGKRESNFALSIYPQLLLSNPTRSVRRDIVDPGPQFLMPMEANGHVGPIRISGEVGCWFSNKSVPSSWIRGVIVGHEFKKKTEVDMELYDQDDTRATATELKTRESTLGIGFHTPLGKKGSVWLLGMVGRSLLPVTPTNGQPSWIASLGLQFVTSRKRRNSID
ncbi:MAG: hypothetical protein P4N24_20945 [Acidobacteriota bacterium]|nr:hypothetical protein [Acidobacteriota bacterium]